MAAHRAGQGDYSTKPRNVVHQRRQCDLYESSSDNENPPSPRRARVVWQIPDDKWAPHLTYLDPHGEGLQNGTRTMRVGDLTIDGAQLRSRELTEVSTLLHPSWHTTDFKKTDQTALFNFETLDKL